MFFWISLISILISPFLSLILLIWIFFLSCLVWLWFCLFCLSFQRTDFLGHWFWVFFILISSSLISTLIWIIYLYLLILSLAHSCSSKYLICIITLYVPGLYGSKLKTLVIGNFSFRLLSLYPVGFGILYFHSYSCIENSDFLFWFLHWSSHHFVVCCPFYRSLCMLYSFSCCWFLALFLYGR